MDWEQFVKDLHAMMLFLIKNGSSCENIMYHVAHDLGGVVTKRRDFEPHCSGYVKIEKGLS